MNKNITININISVDGPTNNTNKACNHRKELCRNFGSAVTVAHQQNNVPILRPKQCIIWQNNVTCVITEHGEIEISCDVRKEGEVGMWL
jgi:hypothetical protein